jgi:hypothetical protein
MLSLDIKVDISDVYAKNHRIKLNLRGIKNYTDNKEIPFDIEFETREKLYKDRECK